MAKHVGIKEAIKEHTTTDKKEEVVADDEDEQVEESRKERISEGIQIQTDLLDKKFRERKKRQ